MNTPSKLQQILLKNLSYSTLVYTSLGNDELAEGALWEIARREREGIKPEMVRA